MKITTPNGTLEGENIEANPQRTRTRLPALCRPERCRPERCRPARCRPTLCQPIGTHRRPNQHPPGRRRHHRLEKSHHTRQSAHHRKTSHSGRRATLQRHWPQMPRQHSASARPARQARQQPPARHHGVQLIRPRLHLPKRRNRARRRLRHQPVERMRPRHPLLHHPHRSHRILGDSK